MARRKTPPKTPSIRQLPSGSYHCQIMSGGKRISVTEDTYDECLSRVMQIQSDRLIGRQSVEKRVRSISFRKAIDLYIEDRSNVLSPSTIRGYHKIQQLRFQTVMDKKLSDEINWQQIINMESKIISPKTLRNSWSLLKSILKVNDLPIPNVRLPQKTEKEHEFLQPEEITKFLELIEDEKYELVYLLALHGLRSSEILGLDVAKCLTAEKIMVRGAAVQTETDEGVRYVKKKENKSKTSRRDVPVLIPRLEEMIRTVPKEELQKKIPGHPEMARKILNRICRNNDLPEVGLHGLRHSFASLCYHLGVNEITAMQLGGWSDFNTMRKIYTHLAEKDKQEASEKLRNFFNNGA